MMWVLGHQVKEGSFRLELLHLFPSLVTLVTLGCVSKISDFYP